MAEYKLDPIHVVMSHLSLLDKAVQEFLPTEIYQNQILHAMIPVVGDQKRTAWRIPESLLRRAITELKVTIQRGDWLQAITDLLPLLGVDRREGQAAPFYSHSEDGSDSKNDSRALIQLFVTCIPPGVIPNVLPLVPYFPSHDDQAELLRGLIPRLPEHQVDEALTLLQRLSEKIK